MKLQEIVSVEVVKRSAGGTFDDLESELVEVGTVLEVTHVSVENRTTGYTRLTIGVGDGLSFIQMEEEDSPPANDIMWTNSRILVPVGKRLRARLTGCTSGDELHLAYQGKLYF